MRRPLTKRQIWTARVSLLGFLFMGAWMTVPLCAEEVAGGAAEQSAEDGAATPEVEVAEAPAVATGVASVASGLWVFIDPVTGLIRSEPTPEQAARVRAYSMSLNKSSDGLVPFELSEGGRGVNLRGRFKHAMVATRQADGSFVFGCSDHQTSVPGESVSSQSVPGESVPVTETSIPEAAEK